MNQFFSIPDLLESSFTFNKISDPSMDFSKLTVPQLREECKKRGLSSTNLKKSELIALLNSSKPKAQSSENEKLTQIKERMARFACKNADGEVNESLSRDISQMEKIEERKLRFANNKKE